MLDKIKILLGLKDDNSHDDLLNALIEICKADALNYCNLEEYLDALDAAVIQMVIERYNKIGNEGVTSNSSSSITLSFIDGYSKPIYQMLQKYRKIRVVK